jgi:hypothetical protein
MRVRDISVDSRRPGCGDSDAIMPGGRLSGVRRAVLFAAAALIGTVVPACASGGGSNGCGAALHTQLDQLSTVHLLPGAPEPSYQTDPPTSGAHRVGGILPRGPVDAPIARPIQVRLLELGSVLVQYRPDVAGAANQLSVLAIGHPLVTVAPNPALPFPVVATAWTWMQSCRAVSVSALRQFIAAHSGHGPGTP